MCNIFSVSKVIFFWEGKGKFFRPATVSHEKLESIIWNYPILEFKSNLCLDWILIDSVYSGVRNSRVGINGGRGINEGGGWKKWRGMENERSREGRIEKCIYDKHGNLSWHSHHNLTMGPFWVTTFKILRFKFLKKSEIKMRGAG